GPTKLEGPPSPLITSFLPRRFANIYVWNIKWIFTSKALIDLLPSLPLDVVEKFRTPVSRMEFMIENQHNNNDNRSQNDDYADGHSSSENEMTTNKKRKARKPRKRSMDKKSRKDDEKIDNFCASFLGECQDDDTAL
uniref:Uncharacterized protein n=1 Tax=Romanomermis culicivorax TaxID=13658 RepID=A0A915JNL6_ROMCU